MAEADNEPEEDDDEFPFPTMAEMGILGPGMAPADWLHIADFTRSIRDQANLDSLGYRLTHTFSKACYQIMREDEPNDDGVLVFLKYHLAVKPDKQVAQFVVQTLQGAFDDNGIIDDEKYAEFMDRAIQFAWEEMDPMQRIKIVEEAEAPPETIVDPTPHENVQTLLYRALD